MDLRAGLTGVAFVVTISLAGSALAQEGSGNSLNSMAEFDSAAYDWWIGQEGKSALEALNRSVGDKERRTPKHILVHLPSGAVVAPYPSDITENARAQVAMIVPKDETVSISLDVKQCTVPQTFRAQFKVEKDILEATGGDPEFQLRTVGPMLRCGPETLEYDIVTQPGADKQSKTTQRLRVNPKYHIAAIFALGWDNAKGNEYFTRAEGDQNFIDWRSSTQGLIAYVGAQWMINGVDYHNMEWWNYFANLWVAVNPASPLKDVAAGLAITPTGGIGVAVGITFHQKTQLGNGFQVGDELTGNGAIPTSTTWTGMKPGFFVGLNIDSNIYRAIKAKVQ